ncbi:MAG TPA: C39 family peptidase [Acidimicrobiales bacterium]|nr:C39 family peptidase [Acidimicrobiales bacterium]
MDATHEGLTGAEARGDLAGASPQALADVPCQLEVLPDGQESLVFGDVNQFADLNHQQGENIYGYQEDCGLVSVQDVLGQFGQSLTESDVVEHAITHGECVTDASGGPANDGGTSPQSQAQVLNDYGVPAHVETGESLEDLASQVEQGHGVIASVNAGYLWDDKTYVGNGHDNNHAVTVTGVARDPVTGAVQGFYINDSGDGQSGQFVSAATMEKAWLGTGGIAVVTDASHPEPAGPSGGGTAPSSPFPGPFAPQASPSNPFSYSYPSSNPLTSPVQPLAGPAGNPWAE